MRWEDERWVKLYVRDTGAWLAVPLASRCFFYELVRKADAAGTIHLGKRPWAALAGMVRGEAGDVEILAQPLLEDGCVVLRGETLIIPNHVAAQEARATPAARKRTQRERARDLALSETPKEIAPPMSREVTRGHAESHEVTPSHDPEQSRPEQTRPDQKLAATPPNPRHRATIDLFKRLWLELRGGEYRVVGERDGAAVKRLLGYPEATDAEIERRMRLAFADAWFRQNGHLALFVSRWPNYDRPASRPVPKDPNYIPPPSPEQADYERRFAEARRKVLAEKGAT